MHRAAAAILGRLSWRTLRSAADRGDRNAIEAVWQGWLRRPDDERWDLLTRWRGAQPMAGVVFAAAADPARPAAARAALGAFCARHQLTPCEPPERARFYLLTGQPEQHRAADPDGSALAAAYRAADEPLRAELRQAMADAGELDLVRVVAAGCADAARGAGAGTATQAERAYLSAELARRQDWPRLWRLALDLPLAETIAAARQLPARWQPPNENGRRLLTRLAAASPAEIAALATPVVTRLDIGTTLSTDCQFAPDGSNLAIRVRRPGSRRGMRRSPAEHFTTVYALPGGRQLHTLSHGHDFLSSCTLHLGAATVCVDDRGGHRLVRHVRGHGVDELTRFDVSAVPRLALVRDGFVVAMSGRLQHGTAEPGSGLRDVTRFVGRHAAVRLLAGEPGTGRVAVVVTDGLVILGPDLHVIAATYDRPDRNDSLRIAEIRFCGPSVLITCDEGTGRFRSWRVDAPMTEQASTVLPHTFPTRFQPLASAGLIVVESQANADPDGTLRPTRRVHRSRTRFFREYLDAGTLQPVECPAVLGWSRHPDEGHERFERLTVSPDRGLAALTRSRSRPNGWVDEVEVRDLARQEVSELASRPLARSRPASLAAITDLAGRARGDDALAVLGLLRACLEYRFDADVAIGRGTRPVAGGDDIALTTTNLGG
jgi:hypothetical protein